MNKQTNITVAILLFTIAVTIYFSYKWTNHDKVELRSSAILKITFCTLSPVCDSTILLTRPQIEDFVGKWNNGISIGYNKYYCQYYIEVYLINGKERTFCTSQDQILEGSGNGWVFTIGDKYYFDSLYQINKSTLRKREQSD